MFLSVVNFINLGCHVKGEYRPVVARLAGELGYPDAARCIRKSEGEGRSQVCKFLLNWSQTIPIFYTMPA